MDKCNPKADNIVKIPIVREETRIGSVFNDLFKVVHKTEGIDSNSVIWDFQGTSFFHPFFIAPLILYRKNSSKTIEVVNKSSAVDSYFKHIHFDDLYHIDDDRTLEQFLNKYRKKTYIPVCRFEPLKRNVDNIQTIIQNIIEWQSRAGSKIKSPLSYFLGELICNIGEHSDAKYGYIFSQCLSYKEKVLNICIADDGITVFGRYVKTNKFLNEINDNEAKSLKLANEGFSTKNLPDGQTRGFGIPTSKRMLVEGLKGAFFMLSGGAFHRYEHGKSDYINLPPKMNWKGTVILMKIPVMIPKDFNYMDYVT